MHSIKNFVRRNCNFDITSTDYDMNVISRFEFVLCEHNLRCSLNFCQINKFITLNLLLQARTYKYKPINFYFYNNNAYIFLSNSHDC